MRFDLVIPAHDEERRIGPTLTLYGRALADPDVRFLVALDGCRDRTAEVVRDRQRRDPRIQLLEFPKLGKGGVLMEALRRCSGDVAGFVDADGATPPSELRRLVDTCDHADGAIASRRHPAAVTPAVRPLGRRVASAGFASGVRRLFRLPYADTQCGAKVFRQEALARLLPLLATRDFLFDVDLLVVARRLGLEVEEVPTVWVDQAGSKLRAGSDSRRMLASALRLWVHHRVLPVEADAAGPQPVGVGVAPQEARSTERPRPHVAA